VWEVDIDWMRSRFADKTLMESPGIPSTRLVDATLLPRDQVSQSDTLQAMFVMGHGVNIHHPDAGSRSWNREARPACRVRPYPTSLVRTLERKNGNLSFAGLHSFEMDGSRTASNRSIQWGEQMVRCLRIEKTTTM